MLVSGRRANLHDAFVPLREGSPCFNLYAACSGLAEPARIQCQGGVGELVPPDAASDISTSALALCGSVLAGLFEPAGSCEKQKET